MGCLHTKDNFLNILSLGLDQQGLFSQFNFGEVFFGCLEVSTEIPDEALEGCPRGEEPCPVGVVSVWVGKKVINLDRIFLPFIVNFLDILIRSWKFDRNIELRVVIDIIYQFLIVFELYPCIAIMKVVSNQVHNVFRSVVLSLFPKILHQLLGLDVQIVPFKIRVKFNWIYLGSRVEVEVKRITVVVISYVSKNWNIFCWQLGRPPEHFHFFLLKS